LIIAIDGPAGAGKSTTARRVAEELGFRYLDTGLMYRAIALGASRAGLSVSSSDGEITALLKRLEVAVVYRDQEQRAILGGVDCTRELRSPEVSAMSSRVARVPAVRTRLVALQRKVAADYADPGIVVEGRDIGTVVFPQAEVKVFLDASVEERVQRRSRELEQRGVSVPRQRLIDEVEARDHSDRSRAIAPLRIADGATRIDTSTLSFEEQVGRVVDLARTVLITQPPFEQADKQSPTKPKQSVVNAD
jgi:cytidylate kinase